MILFGFYGYTSVATVLPKVSFFKLLTVHGTLPGMHHWFDYKADFI